MWARQPPSAAQHHAALRVRLGTFLLQRSGVLDTLSKAASHRLSWRRPP